MLGLTTALRSAAAVAGYAHGARHGGMHVPIAMRGRSVPAAPTPDTWADEYGMIERADGHRLRWHATGAGGPVFVMLHGFSLRGHVWDPQIRRLAQDALVVTVDQRGHGDSDPWRQGQGVSETLAADLACVLDTLGLTDVVLVGHSLGGIALAQFLVDHPDLRDERVSGAVFVSTTGTTRLISSKLWGPLGGPVRPLEDVGRHVAARVIAHEGPRLFKAARRSGVATRLGFGRHAPDDSVLYTHRQLRETHSDTWRNAFRSLGGFDVLDRLRDVPTPALVLCGSHDLITPAYLSRRLHESLPRSELHIVHGAGHMLMLETPDLVADHLRCFAESVMPDVWQSRPAVRAV